MLDRRYSLRSARARQDPYWERSESRPVDGSSPTSDYRLPREDVVGGEEGIRPRGYRLRQGLEAGEETPEPCLLPRKASMGPGATNSSCQGDRGGAFPHLRSGRNSGPPSPAATLEQVLNPVIDLAADAKNYIRSSYLKQGPRSGNLDRRE